MLNKIIAILLLTDIFVSILLLKDLNSPNVIISKCDMITTYTNCEEGDEECVKEYINNYGDD